MRPVMTTREPSTTGSASLSVLRFFVAVALPKGATDCAEAEGRRLVSGWSLALIGNASGQIVGVERDSNIRTEAFSIRRLGGSRWRLRRTRCAMGFECQSGIDRLEEMERSCGENAVKVELRRSRPLEAKEYAETHKEGCFSTARHTNASACGSTSLHRG